MKAVISQALTEIRPDIAASVNYSDFVLERSFSGQVKYILLNKDTGQPAVICKVASGERSVQLLAEANVLRRLASASPDIRDAVPQLLFAGKLETRYLLAIPWIPGYSLLHSIRSGQNGISGLNRAIGWITKLHQETGRVRRFSANDYEHLVDDSVDRILRYLSPPSSLRRVLKETQAFLRDLLGSELPFVMQHGDYEFGNLLISHDGRMVVIDWELANTNAPPFRDLAHLLIAYPVNTRGLTYGQAVYNAFIDRGEYANYVDSQVEFYCNSICLSKDLRNHLLALCIIGDAAQWAQRAQSEIVSDWWWWHLGVLTDVIDLGNNSMSIKLPVTQA